MFTEQRQFVIETHVKRKMLEEKIADFELELEVSFDSLDHSCSLIADYLPTSPNSNLQVTVIKPVKSVQKPVN